MNIKNFILNLLFFTILFNHPVNAEEPDWNNFTASVNYWLNISPEKSEYVSYYYQNLPAFYQINYYLLHQYLTQPHQPWRAVKLLNFWNSSLGGPIIYKEMMISQKPLIYKKVPIRVFYFIENTNDPSKKLVLETGSDTNLYILHKNRGNSSSTLLPMEFEKDFSSFIKATNPFQGGVIEYTRNRLFQFMHKAEKLKFSWENIILDPAFKQILIRGIDGFLKNYDYKEWKKLGLPLSQGVLLSGPPGTGKTLIAKILATQVLDKSYKSSFSYIHVQARHIYWTGTIKEIYDLARYLGNTIIFFEDIDLIAGTNRLNRPEIKNELMQQLSGIEALEGVMTIGTTNYPQEIDPALKRSGRLGLHYYFGPLLFPQRLSLIELFFKGKIENDVNLNDLTINTDQFTGADLQALYQLIHDESVKRSTKSGAPPGKITNEDILNGFALYRKTKFKEKE